MIYACMYSALVIQNMHDTLCIWITVKPYEPTDERLENLQAEHETVTSRCATMEDSNALLEKALAAQRAGE